MERAHALTGNGKIPAGEFGGGGAREGRDQDRVRAIAIDGALDLARQVGRLPRAQLRGAEDTEFPCFFGPRLLFRNLRDAVGFVRHISSSSGGASVTCGQRP